MGFPGICSFFSTNCPLKVEWLDPQVGLHDKEWIIDARSYCSFSMITSERLHIFDFFSSADGGFTVIKVWHSLINWNISNLCSSLIRQSNPKFTRICGKQTISLFRHTMKETFVWILTITICWLKQEQFIFINKKYLCYHYHACLKYS